MLLDMDMWQIPRSVLCQVLWPVMSQWDGWPPQYILHIADSDKKVVFITECCGVSGDLLILRKPVSSCNHIFSE